MFQLKIWRHFIYKWRTPEVTLFKYCQLLSLLWGMSWWQRMWLLIHYVLSTVQVWGNSGPSLWGYCQIVCSSHKETKRAYRRHKNNNSREKTQTQKMCHLKWLCIWSLCLLDNVSALHSQLSTFTSNKTLLIQSWTNFCFSEINQHTSLPLKKSLLYLPKDVIKHEIRWVPMLLESVFLELQKICISKIVAEAAT